MLGLLLFLNLLVAWDTWYFMRNQKTIYLKGEINYDERETGKDKNICEGA